MHKPIIRSLSIVIVIGLTIKALLYAWVYQAFGISPIDLMAAHDGQEYISYAQIIGTGTFGALPVEVLRHDPGLPLLLSTLWLVTGKVISLGFCALLLQLTGWVIGVVLIRKMCEQWSTGVNCRPSLMVAAALGYPASLYYGQFNLTEPLFIALILGSILLAGSDKYLLAFVLAGLSALVRTTGLLLVLSLLFTHPAILHVIKNPRGLWSLSGYATLGFGPWILTQVIFHQVFHTNFSVYQPQFGWPFSGFRGLAEAGTVRSIYIIAAVGFFIISTTGLFLITARARWRSTLQNTATAFAVIFLSFHICLKTLYYIDRQVWTFDYQDRYLVPLWPLAVLVWQKWINWPVAMALLAGSCGITIYWTRNYLIAAGI